MQIFVQYLVPSFVQIYNLWRQVSGAIDAFYKDMAEHGLENDALVMTYSEFGRRPNENASRGTDHGTASVMFVVGKQVNAVFMERNLLSKPPQSIAPAICALRQTSVRSMRR